MREKTCLLPEFIETSLSSAHPTWQAHLRDGLHAMSSTTPNYFADLVKSEFLPSEHRLFAAFSQPIESVRYVLLGEGPYPRIASATGVCFIDGAVNSLWQPGVGLSKPVNRATSLRNFIKMLLVADGELNASYTTLSALKSVADCASVASSGWIQTAAELQSNLMQHGFLLLNASLVFRNGVAPIKDAKAWLPFLHAVLKALSARNKFNSQLGNVAPIKLILWGKIAEKVKSLPEANDFLIQASEHPYNLSFINNEVMQNLFRPLHLLKS